ncbi:DUF4337 domain-containing protein [Bosea sp. (in: a-proteobacteria)]|jgi:uncharacterized Tic20 family protein|uniref:DUF4337 domain-containing protein n=1 Tax=Bosea sp. (in: a-proteobacteria) TaxID=1871050 RepID=UPI002DDDAE44|nr:DUF4337 domain-containing protein [Bosea sp. (in: a-proteobacteria)]HEV2511704.1 DUF4337 domain-containing protein [Bosea sp. (in: a-proteobacteria)]
MASAAPDVTEDSPPTSKTNKRIALLIGVLALLLAFSEILGKNAEQDALSRNIEASNLWAFFQAKTIRGTTLRTAADAMEVELAGSTDPAVRERLQKRIDGWKATIARYDSEPETNEGRKELIARAKAAEARRDISSARDDKYDIVSGLLQIAIVVSSAAIITGVALLAWTGVGLGILGFVLMVIAEVAPTALF